MTTERLTADNADAAAADAAASDEHVCSLQNQPQSTAEEVVGASGSQAVEPGQPGQPAATKTAQPQEPQVKPGVPRYVVPPTTGNLAYGRSHWDGKPAEIHAMILKHAGPLTRFLCGLLGDKRRIDQATKLQLWIDAFKTDWQGDLRLLPSVDLTANNGLLLAHSRSMYNRLCKRFPRCTEVSYAGSDADKNNHDLSFYHDSWNSKRLLLIPMRHGWFDLLDFTHPIALARIAISFGFVDLLKHLDRTHDALRGWMVEHDTTTEIWHSAIDRASCNGHLDVVQYLFEAGVAGCTVDAMDWAAANGHLPVVIWLHENRTEGCATAAMECAARDGHLHVVKWLHANRTEGCTTNAMDWAAMYGRLHVAKWLHENRTEGCTDQAMVYAAGRGHLSMVQWLHETHGEACSSAALDAAISRGYTDVVKYMHSRGGRASSSAVETASIDGNVEMLQHLMDCGYAVELGAINRATNMAAANILLGSLTLARAQALLAENNRRNGFAVTTQRLESTIAELQKGCK